MAVSTTQSIWRSGGGDQTRTAYCGTGLMAAKFYVANVAATTANVQVSSTITSPVILPVGAVVASIDVAAASTTGGTNPTFSLGYLGRTSGNAATTAFIANSTAVRKSVDLNTATAGTNLGLVAATASNELFNITATVGGNAATSGTLSGTIYYFVNDPLSGQQNV